MTRQEWFIRKAKKEDKERYKEYKARQDKEEKTRQLEAIDKEVFRSQTTTNYKDLEMKATTIWNYMFSINETKKEVKAINIERGNDIKSLISKIEDLVKKINRFNSLKYIDTYERIGMTRLEKDINDILEDYKEVKENENISPFAKRENLLRMAQRFTNIYKKLCKEYNVD